MATRTTCRREVQSRQCNVYLNNATKLSVFEQNVAMLLP
jgi:hypothetical protein